MGCGGQEPRARRGPTVKTPRPAPVAEASGSFVAIGDGRSLYMECVGSGSPAVVLEAGFGADTLSWRDVQPEVGRGTRTCAYDRAGTGNSVAPPGVRDARDEIADLRRLAELLLPCELAIGVRPERDCPPALFGSVVTVARRKRALSEHEQKTIHAFVTKDRRERELLRLARGGVDDSLWSHRPPLDPGAMWQIPPGWSADQLLEELKRRGAPDVAVGIHGQLARQTVALPDAVRSVFAARHGDLISLVPGRLAYYDGEDEHASYVLSR